MKNTIKFDITNKAESLAFAHLVASFNEAGVPLDIQNDGCVVLVTTTSGY